MNAKPERKYIPNKERAIVSANYAVIINGQRRVIFHNASEPLRGKIQ